MKPLMSLLLLLFLISRVTASTKVLQNVKLKNDMAFVGHKKTIVKIVREKKTNPQETYMSNLKRVNNAELANQSKKKRQNIVKCCGVSRCQDVYNKNLGNENGLKFQGRSAKLIRNNYNGPSEKVVRIAGVLYKFPKEKATYMEAKRNCERGGMMLATIESDEEMKNVRDYLSYVGLTNEQVYLHQSKADHKKRVGPNDMCKGYYRRDRTRIPCQKKANYICKLAKEDLKEKVDDGAKAEEGESAGSNDVTQSSEPSGGDSGNFDLSAFFSMGMESVKSIENAVMDFVGGKNYVVPSEKGTQKDAQSVCGKQGMDLISIESIAEMDSVTSFLGNIGLSSETLLTSVKKVTDGTGNWLGDIGASLMAGNPSADTSKDGDCLGLGSLGLVGVTCDMVSNFVCEAPDVPSYDSAAKVEFVNFPKSILKCPKIRKADQFS